MIKATSGQTVTCRLDGSRNRDRWPASAARPPATSPQGWSAPARAGTALALAAAATPGTRRRRPASCVADLLHQACFIAGGRGRGFRLGPRGGGGSRLTDLSAM
jgi:hypothetical protein